MTAAEGNARWQAVEQVRADHLAHASAAGKPRPDNCEVCAALSLLEQLAEAAALIADYATSGDVRESGPYVLVREDEINALTAALAAVRAGRASA